MEKLQLQHDNIWTTRCVYEAAETNYYEKKAKESVTPLAGEVAKARQLLIESRDSFRDSAADLPANDAGALKFFEKQLVEYQKSLDNILKKLDEVDTRLTNLEKCGKTAVASAPAPVAPVAPASKAADDDDDVDLFDSDEEEDAAAAKIREDRLAAYNSKKSKKPVLIAKSNVILDVKPWDDETDMKLLEGEVRKIVKDGLLWGAAKLVPLAYGINKLQISCVVEDDKISIDELTEQLQEIEEYIQSVDIAAFNKI